MRSRLARLGLLGVGVLALLGSTTPPAQAHTDAVVTFTALVRLDGGLDYPCLNKPCPPTATTVLDLPLQNYPVNTNTHVEWTGNRRGIQSIASGGNPGGCTIEGIQGLNKQPPKQPGPFVHGCSFTTAQNPNGKPNYVKGHCGLSGGQVFVVLTDDLGQRYEFDVHFTSTATVINFTGHWRKQNNPEQHGKLVGTTSATPAGVVDQNNSCANKTARIFNLAGTLEMTQDPLLLPLV